MSRWETISFDCPPELYEELQATIDESVTLENQSQAIRAGIRLLVSTDEQEFDSAR